MKNYKISVIVPVYGIEELLPRCVDSLLAQTYTNFELLLIDDGSKDKCPQICDEYAKKNERVKVFHKENGGLVDAWVFGVKKSTGDLIAFIDGDDWCEVEYLNKLVQPFYEHGVDISICGYYISNDSYRERGSEIHGKYEGLIEGEKLAEIKTKTIKKPNNFIPLYRWNKLYKRELIVNNLKYADTRMTISEDSTIVQATILDAKKIYITHESLHNYYYRATSIINTYKANWHEKALIYFSYFKQLYKDKGLENSPGLNFERIRIAHLLLKNILKSKGKDKKQKFLELCDSEFVKDINLKNSEFSYRAKLLTKSLKKKRYTLAMTLVKGKMAIEKIRKCRDKLLGKYKKYEL